MNKKILSLLLATFILSGCQLTREEDNPEGIMSASESNILDCSSSIPKGETVNDREVLAKECKSKIITGEIEEMLKKHLAGTGVKTISNEGVYYLDIKEKLIFSSEKFEILISF